MMTVTQPPPEEKLIEGKDGNVGFEMQFWLGLIPIIHISAKF